MFNRMMLGIILAELLIFTISAGAQDIDRTWNDTDCCPSKQMGGNWALI